MTGRLLHRWPPGTRRIAPPCRCVPQQRVQPNVAIPPITRISALQHSGANLIVALPHLLAPSNARFPAPPWPALL